MLGRCFDGQVMDLKTNATVRKSQPGPPDPTGLERTVSRASGGAVRGGEQIDTSPAGRTTSRIASAGEALFLSSPIAGIGAAECYPLSHGGAPPDNVKR